MKKMILLIMFIGVFAVCNVDLLWEYDSPLTIVETITDIGGGDYRYEYSFTNVDTSTIWDFHLYTTFNVQPENTFSGYEKWVEPQFVTVSRYRRYNPLYDPQVLDAEIIGGVWTGYEYWGIAGEESGILPNDHAEGFSFTSNIYDLTPKYYSYITIETNGPEPYFQGMFSAVGTTVPEPASIAFLGLGFWVVRKGTMS